MIGNEFDRIVNEFDSAAGEFTAEDKKLVNEFTEQFSAFAAEVSRTGGESLAADAKVPVWFICSIIDSAKRNIVENGAPILQVGVQVFLAGYLLGKRSMRQPEALPLATLPASSRIQ